MSKLNGAIAEIVNLPKSDKVNIKGKFYTQVVTRVDEFRKAYGDAASITTKVILHDKERVVVKATIKVFNDGKWNVIGSDYAEEFRGEGMVNKTSALENCCTSAIGRALSACGLGGGEYASSFEVDNAINNKSSAPAITKTKNPPYESPAVDEEKRPMKIPKGKYKIISDNKAVVINTDDEAKYLHHLRTFLKDPLSEECQRIYTLNASTIKKASMACSGDIKESYEKLLGIYDVDTK